MGSKMMPIYSDKLEAALKAHGLNKCDTSERLGFGRRYLSDSMRRERLSSNAVAGINLLFSIDPKLYVKDTEEEVTTEPEKEEDINYVKLYEVIYSAVYKAIIDAMKTI